jgi:hypothetical protein
MYTTKGVAVLAYATTLLAGWRNSPSLLFGKKIGYLVISYKTKRTDNIGGDLIRTILQNTGFDVDICGPQDINKYDLVLHSIPSTYQLIDLLKAARKHSFEKRKTKILIGGFGVQNITAIKPYVDFAYYGRAHNDIVSVVSAILADGDVDNPYLYNIARDNNVTVNQAPLCTEYFKEEFVGCVNKCKFCHYSWSRKPQGNPGGYVQNLLMKGNSPEVLWKDIFDFKTKPGRIRTAIDGFSERLRLNYGKQITDDDITNGINHLGSLRKAGLAKGLTAVVVLVYNIGHMPGETEDDWQALTDAVNKANPQNRVIFIVHTTPFRPSILTPMQWEPVKLWPEWSSMREMVIRDDASLLSKYSFTLEGAFSHLSSVIIDRLQDPYDAVLQGILHPKGKTSAQRAAYLLDRYNAESFLQEMPIDTYAPVPYLEGYVSNSRLRAIAKKMRQQAKANRYELAN